MNTSQSIDVPTTGALVATRPTEGKVFLGKTLPELLYDANRQYKNPKLFNWRKDDEWVSIGLDEFTSWAEEVGQGLLSLGLEPGDRVALFMESDPMFCLVDMGSLMTGVIDVPLYITQSAQNNAYILKHSGSKALFVSTLDHLEQIEHVLPQAPEIQTIIVADLVEDEALTRIPQGMRWFSLQRVQEMGRQYLAEHPNELKDRIEAIKPDDLATIVYTSGTTGEPKGVMLTHENLSCNALTANNELGDFEPGPDGEVNLSFLPLSHIFARTLYYSVVAQASSTYFTTPDRVAEDLKEVQPTMFASVPRLLEKVYSKILEKATTLDGYKKKLFNWALNLADRFEIGSKPKGFYNMQIKLADRLVFKLWRKALGGRVKYIISGGAALNGDLANLFAAAGVNVLQGYGLTETSPIISFNRPTRNRAGTVGEVLPGIEVKIADDGEILTRGHHIMQGYYKNSEKTEEVIDDDGWFHTGDVGELSDDGFLTITDRKKDLFKLSTGKYVMPQPLENRLNAHPLIEQSVVVGSGHKFCAALLFVDHHTLGIYADSRGIPQTGGIEQLCKHPMILARYQELIEIANEGMDHWSTIKRFKIIPDHLTVDNNMLTPSMKVRRSAVTKHYAEVIKAMYAEDVA